MIAKRLLIEERNYNEKELQQQKAESVPKLNAAQRKDAAPMNDRRCFEAMDRSLEDILTMPHRLFGGKSILLGGDFRKTLPVKKGASKMEVIVSCISESELWS
ncbi:DNA helicase [Tanacetum coccineum]